MKFMCLGYFQESAWHARPKEEQDALVEECLSYDDVLRKEGTWLDGGAALQPAGSARTLRWVNGRVVVTDGPYAETKEVLGGLLLLEARDMSHAVELLSKHPGVRIGPFEIRAVDEQFTAFVEERRRRLEKAAGK